MEIRQKTPFCGVDTEATTRKFRGRFEARHGEGQGSPNGNKLKQRRRPRSAVSTDYLGVSSIAFPPPLRHYLRSPQHGRYSLRSSRPASAGARSHAGSSGLGRHVITAAARWAWSTTSTSRRKPARRKTAAISTETNDNEYARSHSTGLIEQDHGLSELAAEEAGGDDDGLAEMHFSAEMSSAQRLLTPVGPDWSEGASCSTTCIVNKAGQLEMGGIPRQAPNSQTPVPTSYGGGSKSEEGFTSNPDRAIDAAIVCDGHSFDRDCDDSIEEEPLKGRQGGQPTRGKLRANRHRRRTQHSPAWDLLTGRRMESHLRKYTSHVHKPTEVPRSPARSTWEPYPTMPLEYPTSTVKQGVARFHEQAQRTRLIEGKEPLEGLPNVREPKTGVRPAHAAPRFGSKELPPPLRWPDQKNMTAGDVLITIEHCTACARHRMSLHHNADVYMQRAAAVKTSVERALADVGQQPCGGGLHGVEHNGRQGDGETMEGRARKNFSVLTKPSVELSSTDKIGRVGAFEVQVTACLLAEKGPKAGATPWKSQTRPSSCSVGGGLGIVRSSTISSKLSSGRWPRPNVVANKVVRTLQQWGALQPPQFGQLQLNSHMFSSESRADVPGRSGPPARRAEPESAVQATVNAQDELTDNMEQVTGVQGSFPTTELGLSSSVGDHSDKPNVMPPAEEEMRESGGYSTGDGPRGSCTGGLGNGGGDTRAGENNHKYIFSTLQKEDRGLDVEEGQVPSRGTGTTPPWTVSRSPEAFSLSVEDVFAEGLEFAAEGNTSDPCFLLRVGTRRSKKSEPVVDVPGGLGGRCHWPGQVCVMKHLREEEVRSSGFEVELWDDLGWIIAKGKVPPKKSYLALEAAHLSLAGFPALSPACKESKPCWSSAEVTCPLTPDRRPAHGGEGSVRFTIRILRPDETDIACKIVEEGTDPHSIGSGPTKETTAELMSRRESVKRSVVEKEPCEGSCPPQQPCTAEERNQIPNISEDPSSPMRAGDAVFENIDDLLGFSPHSSGRGGRNGSILAASVSGMSAANISGESGFISSALEEGFPGSRGAANDPLNEPWSSVEEVRETKSIRGNENKNEPTGTKSARIEVAPGEGTGGTTERLQEKFDTCHSDAAYLPPPTIATAVKEIDTEDGVIPGPGLPGLSLQLSSHGVASLADGNADDTSYDDEDFENNIEAAHVDQARASGARSLVSFSSTSSSPSIENGSERDDDSTEENGTRELRLHARAEVVLTEAAAKWRHRLRRAAEKCGSAIGGSGGEPAGEGVLQLFNSLDEDHDGQLTRQDLRRTLYWPSYAKRKRAGVSTILSESHLLFALVAGMDRVGKRSVNIREFEAFILGEGAGKPQSEREAFNGQGPQHAPRASFPPGGVEMAALWFRLRNAAAGQSRRFEHLNADGGRQAESASLERTKVRVSDSKIVDHVEAGREDCGESSEADRAVDLSRVGAGLFEKSDPTGSGCLSSAAFVEVISSADVGIVPPLSEIETAALCRHFRASNGGRNHGLEEREIADLAQDGGSLQSLCSNAMISYRAFVGWVDPVDVVRVSKRVSRFLRAVGDNTSKFGSTVASGETAVRAGPKDGVAVAGSATGTARIRSSLETSAPPAVDSTSKSLIGDDKDMAGVGGASKSARSDWRGDGRREEPEMVERMAIADIFRRIDMDASGQVSEEEFLEAVNGLGLPISEEEARLLIVEYCSTTGESFTGPREKEGGGIPGQLSLDDFDGMISRQRPVSCIERAIL